ncbi:MAG TPA: hypothetical protein VNF91_01510 [Candidatus Acidoferrum sp.]|nr:hypothetical protein [Candidatus Acidoferrum sp.]HXJ47820.1 hypothetical protein [Candidatus Acidoferrum sp.]
MKRYLEIGFGHKLLLLAPLLAALIATAAYVLIQPPSYQSSATVWVNGGGVGTQSPAQSQADIVNQYLKTNSFAVSVAKGGPLAGYLNTHPSALPSAGVRTQLSGLLGGKATATQASPDEIKQYLGAHVTITQLGPSELVLAVTAPTPQLASGTANALITQLTSAEVAAKTAAGQAQLALYQSQLQDEAKVLSDDLAAVQKYLASHPNLARDPAAAAGDAQLAVLQDAATVARQTYLALLAKIDQTQSDLALAEQPRLAPFRVVDAPQTPSSQSLFTKQMLLAIAAGLVAGVLLLAALAAVLVRLDTTIHDPSEVESMVGLQAIGSTPLSARA